MACIQTLSSLSVNCEPNVGGIIEVYIANRDDVTKLTTDDQSQKITAITMADTAKKFIKYSFRRGTGSMVSTLNVDDANGTNYVQTDLSLIFAKMETLKRIEMTALSLGEFVVIVKDCNGLYWYLGMNESVMATAGGGQTGQARGDANNYTLTLTDYSKTYPYEVEEEAVTAVI